jgi:hypothetical protein
VDVLDDLQTWWQNLNPQTQAAAQYGSLVLGALLIGHFLGGMVARALRARNFDAALRLPGSSPPPAEADRNITPSFLGGLLVRLTVWAGAAWWVLLQYGQTELAARLAMIISRSWAIATVLVAALTLGSLLARRLIDCLEVAPKGTAAVPQRSMAGAVGAAVYGMVVLFVLLIAADLFDWPLTRTSAQALWQLAHHLLIAGAAVLIGWLGARWARDLGAPEASASPEKKASHYTALGIVAASTILAVAVLLSSAGLLLGLAALAVLGFLIWLVRGYLPDVIAGLQLRAHSVREVWFDGVAWQVASVGFLTTQVSRNGEFCRVQNRLVLEARLHGAPTEAGSR